ncbi:MAG: metalloregulator ArsR/SmtB family transcription factor [Clostridiales bacterium]|nr:metalloregulator ArsR/SmtB family transcription factor [Clostridiales bacterium]MCF8021893.1 metalloregulator ArsR/SmtB family transcription factor [Clostridiales bacterium]
MEAKKYQKQAELLKALAHPTRLCIVNGLLDREQCNVSTIKECMHIPQSTVSQQLAVLRSKGIVQGERKGLEVCYRVIDQRAKKIVEILNDDKVIQG